jgi:hypothetical protein
MGVTRNMEKLSHKIMMGSAVANTVITTLAFFYFVVQEMVQ